MSKKEGEFPFPNALDYMLRLCNGDVELVKYFSQIIGYGMTTYTSEKIIPICWGSGSNGKTSFFRLMGKILNDFYLPIPNTKIVSRPTAHSKPLMGIRLASFRTDEPHKYSNGLKILSGRESITIKKTTFKPACKIFVITNTKPKFDSNDQELVDRVRILPFLAEFKDTPENNEYLKKIEQKHLDELASFFLMGANDWHQNGFMKMPEVCKEHLRECFV